MTENLTSRVYEVLQKHARGRAEAVKAARLAVELNSTMRDINEAVRCLRRRGHFIGSAKTKPYGYYIPVTAQEIDAYLYAFKSELFDMLQTFNRQKRAKARYMESLRAGDLFGYRCGDSGQFSFREE